MKKFICRIFGHKWFYYVLAIPNYRFHEIRVCSRCGLGQHWKEVSPGAYKIWINMVQYTDQGARTNVERYEKK